MIQIFEIQMKLEFVGVKNTNPAMAVAYLHIITAV